MSCNYITPDDLVEKLRGTTRGYWAQLRFTGKGPRFYKPSSKVVLYDEADVEAWIQKSARMQTGPVSAA